MILIILNYVLNSLDVFDPSGKFVHSTGGYNGPYGVSVSPDGSVWVADYGNNRLAKS